VITADKLPMIKEKIIMPVVNELKKRGITYRGILYAGLMVNDENSNPRGPLAKSGSTVNVVEFNARFGDPETEAVLPRLGGEFARALLNAAKGCLKSDDIIVKDEVAATVIVASAGYPGDYEKGKAISGMEDDDDTTVVFHCGTKRTDSGIVTAGGRVLSVTGVVTTLRDAVNAAYARIDRLSFDGMFFRKDIAHRAFEREN
jgi:phosphoribosylamine--glycine ligase